jgi:hypothetical protein
MLKFLCAALLAGDTYLTPLLAIDNDAGKPLTVLRLEVV